MNIVCLDLEGVLVPGDMDRVFERKRDRRAKKTTRDEPDYDRDFMEVSCHP